MEHLPSVLHGCGSANRQVVIGGLVTTGRRGGGAKHNVRCSQGEYYNCPSQIFLKFPGLQDSGMERYPCPKNAAEIVPYK